MKTLPTSPSLALKILIIRASSIGDIVLTSPAIELTGKLFPESEIYFLVKKSFLATIEHNPHINEILELKSPIRKTIRILAQINFSIIIDLHNNLRSNWICFNLKIKNPKINIYSVPKRNFDKWLITKFKKKISVEHFADRACKTIVSAALDTRNHGFDFANDGLSFFTDQTQKQAAKNFILNHFPNKNIPPVGIVLGATKFTKRWCQEYFPKLINLLNEPIILLGGKSDENVSNFIMNSFSCNESQVQQPKIIDAVGKFDLGTSAEILSHCKYIITHDTGLMHIAAAYHLKVIVIWGNTIPEFGMEPYKCPHLNIQIENLSCRPCSKIGYDACPKGHFDCMKKITPELVAFQIQQWIGNL